MQNIPWMCYSTLNNVDDGVNEGTNGVKTYEADPGGDWGEEQKL